MRLGNNVALGDYDGAIPLDPNDPDSDKDGLLDGQELKVMSEDDGNGNIKVWLVMRSNPCTADTDGDGFIDKKDKRPLVKDARVDFMDGNHVVFNTGHEWKRINCTARDFYNYNIMDEWSPISLYDMTLIWDARYYNAQQAFTPEEIVFLTPYNLEGLKLHFDATNDIALRDAAFVNMFGRYPVYKKKDESSPLVPWVVVNGYENGGFFAGKVISEADIMFTYARGEAKEDLDDYMRLLMGPFPNIVDSLTYVFSGQEVDGGSYFKGFMVGLADTLIYGVTGLPIIELTSTEINNLLATDNDFKAGYMMGSGTVELAAMVAVYYVTTPTTPSGENIVGTNHSTVKPTQEVVNHVKVAEYVQKLSNGETIAPIQVIDVPGQGLYITDGHHRYIASQLTGIPVDMVITSAPGPIGLPDWSSVIYKKYVNESQFWDL